MSLANQFKQVRSSYRARLIAYIDYIRFLLRQGLAFCGHHESDESLNQDNFIELLKFLTENNEEINKVVLNNAPENLKLTSPKIQKDIINAAAIETTTTIASNIED